MPPLATSPRVRRGKGALALVAALLLVLVTSPGAAAQAPGTDQPTDAEFKIICTVPTYGDLARILGGPKAEVVVMARPGQDMHAVMPTPSLMQRVRNADMCVHSGLDAELWLEQLLRGSGNVKLLPGSPTGTSLSVNMSVGIKLKQVPTVFDRSQGDIHAFGNPHIWTDPYNVRIMAKTLKDAMVAAWPAEAAGIEERHKAFHDELTKKLVGWLTEYRGLKGQLVVPQHMSWVYFLDRFGVSEAGYLEPKPRLPPTPSHLATIVEIVEARGVRVLIREPYQPPQASEFVSEKTGATVIEMSTHPGWPDGVDGIIEHFEYNLKTLSDALATDG